MRLIAKPARSIILPEIEAAAANGHDEHRKSCSSIYLYFSIYLSIYLAEWELWKSIEIVG